MMGKSSECCDQMGLKKGPWTSEEDQKLIDYIHKHGHGRWRTLPKNAGLKRCGKSCRLRWTNYLRPDIKRGEFSIEEEDAIIQLHSVLGNKWSAIAGHLPGRTDNEIKNYWNTHVKKRLLRMGIDPVTHKPRLDILQLYSALNSSLYNSSSDPFNMSSLLGHASMLSPSLLNATSSLLSQTKENFQENQIGNNQAQDQLLGFQPNQVQAYAVSSSGPQFLNETQFMQPNLEQLSNNQYSNLSCQTQTSWHANVEVSTSMGGGLMPNYGYDDTSQQNLSPYFENLPKLSAFSSLMSTPSSSTTPLQSSSATYVNGGTEDERDSYCSNIVMFGHIPNCLDVNGYV